MRGVRNTRRCLAHCANWHRFHLYGLWKGDMRITPEMATALDRAIDAHGGVQPLAERLRVAHDAIRRWRSGEGIDGAIWMNRLLPLLLDYMTETEARAAVPPHVLDYVLKWRRILAGLKKNKAKSRTKRPRKIVPAETILAWADEYRKRNGRWPTRKSGPVEGADVTWHAVYAALERGRWGFPGGSSLGKLLRKHGRPVHTWGMKDLRPLTLRQIESWALEYFKGKGKWPSLYSGSAYLPDGEKWRNINTALMFGRRGQPEGGSLAKLVKERLEPKYGAAKPLLSVGEILSWADEHFKRTGKWPNAASGQVCAAPKRKWSGVNTFLRHEAKGRPGGSSLAKLIAKHRKNPGP